MSSKTLYIIRGVPGSGKSTLAHQLSKTVVETDDFMMVDGEYKYDKDKVYACHKKCFNKVLDYMAHSVTPIAVANTFIKKKDYKPYVDLAKEFGYNVEIKVCKGDYKNNHNVSQDRVEQMKSKFQESINSLLEMNCDTGIETIIENKKKSLFEGYDFENITRLSKTSNGYDITAMGSKIGYIVAKMDSSNQLHIGYIEILPEYRQNGIATIALGLLKDELKPTSVIANITSIASLNAFCNVFGKPSYSSNVDGMEVSPSYGLPEYPTETTNTDGEYNTCMWKLSNTIRESVEPKLNDNFWKWFGNSKVVDENGQPLVVYHGSPNKFEIFDILKTTDNLTYGKGFYFTNDKSAGDEYAGSNGKNYACYIRLINPYIVNSPNMTHEERLKRTRIFRNKTDSRTELIKQGYDGILYEEYDEHGQYIEVVAFYPNQIKSVNNNGNWSLNSDNINESKEIKLNNNFKKWFGNSKCVDKNGNPKVFIHRSNAKFNAFDKSKIGQRDHGWYGKGFYFGSAKQKDYKLYGKHVYKCFLRIENPFYYNEFFGSYSPNEMQMITAYDKLGILTPQESNFLQKYMDAYNHFDSNVKLKKVPQKVKDYNGKVYDSFYWVVQYNSKTTKTDAYMNPRDNTEDYAKAMFWREHYEKYFEKIEQINHNCYKTRMDKMSNAIRNMGYDGIVNADEYVVFEPNQIKSINNNGNWSLEVDNINEEKEVIEERLFPELSDRKYNELLWFTTPNMTANAYTKFFGKEMVADRIPAKYLVTLSSNDISLKDLVEKHRKLHNAKQVKPIADYKDFNDFITDLNKSKYLSRNDKSNIAKSGAKIIKSFGDWDLYDITTWEAAKKYGSGTTWCVTDSTSDDYFNRYTNRLPFNNYQTEEDMKKSKRSLLFLINPNTDRKMAIAILKKMDYDWYDDLIEFYNEEDEFFYTYCHTTEGSISLKDDIMEKISYSGDDWPDADVVEDYGVTEDFIMSVTQFIKDTYRMNQEEIVEDINKLRQKYKQLMNIKESANSTNMTWEEFVEKVGRENEFDGSVVISKHNTSIIIRQSGIILVRIGKNPFKKAYSNLKTFDEIYNMLVEKGFVEEQILTEAVDQHPLYHGCDLVHAVSMMIDNAMRGETIAHINGKQYQGNSLTRSLQFAKDWSKERFDGDGDELSKFWVVLELNKEKLKTKYKILPYNYWEDCFGKDYEHTNDRNGYGNQYEEFVVGKINNLRKYIDDIYLSDDCLYGEYAELLAIVKRELELRGKDYSESDIEKALQQLGIHKPSPDDLNNTKINENYKKLSDDSGIVEVFSYNDIKGFLNRCSFGARGLLNKKDGSVYLDFVEESIHSDMVNELQSSGIDIDQDNIIRFLVYNDYMKAMDSEYAEELKFGTRGIQFLTNNDIYVLIKNYHYNETLNNLLKLDTMDDVDVVTLSNWENNGFETLDEAHSYYINNVKLYENPSIQWMKKKLNNGTELRILIDGDLEEPYFGEWIVWDAGDANHKKVLDSLNLYEEDYISVRLCKDSIRYWGYTKEKIDKLQECEIIQKLYPNGYELINEW